MYSIIVDCGPLNFQRSMMVVEDGMLEKTIAYQMPSDLEISDAILDRVDRLYGQVDYIGLQGPIDYCSHIQDKLKQKLVLAYENNNIEIEVINK